MAKYRYKIHDINDGLLSLGFVRIPSNNIYTQYTHDTLDWIRYDYLTDELTIYTHGFKKIKLSNIEPYGYLKELNRLVKVNKIYSIIKK